MKVEQFVELVREGVHPIVKCTTQISEVCEESLDPFMMGKIIGVSQEYEDSYRFLMDLNGYEKHNESVAKRNWFNKDNEPKLTWMETNFYPEDGIEAVYIRINTEIPFEIIEQDSLFAEYISISSEKSYIKWLETTVKELRAKN